MRKKAVVNDANGEPYVSLTKTKEHLMIRLYNNQKPRARPYIIGLDSRYTNAIIKALEAISNE